MEIVRPSGSTNVFCTHTQSIHARINESSYPSFIIKRPKVNQDRDIYLVDTLKKENLIQLEIYVHFIKEYINAHGNHAYHILF